MFRHHFDYDGPTFREAEGGSPNRQYRANRIVNLDLDRDKPLWVNLALRYLSKLIETNTLPRNVPVRYVVLCLDNLLNPAK